MKKYRMRTAKSGKNTRMSFSANKEVLEMPNLIEVQVSSYEWFLNEGLKEVFKDISPISDYTNKFSLEFGDYCIRTDKIKYSIEECKERDATYEAPLEVNIRLRNNETGAIQHEDGCFFGNLPLMTDTGTFVINGAERVIVSQLVRSPGIYYDIANDKVGKKLFSCTVIPNRGAWLEYETDSNDIFYVHVDRTRKVPVTVLIRALLGADEGTDEKILEIFGDEKKILRCIAKESTTAKNELEKKNIREEDMPKDMGYNSHEAGLRELYKKIRPGEPFALASAESLVNGMFYDAKRYDLAKVGRYKYNKKLALENRISGYKLAEDVVTADGEILYEADTVVTRDIARAIQNAAIDHVYIWVTVKEEVVDEEVVIEDGVEKTVKKVSGGPKVYVDKIKKIKILSNLTVDVTKLDDGIYAEIGEVLDELGVTEGLYYPVFASLVEECSKEGELDIEELKTLVKNNINELVPKHITREDIFASINYNIHLEYGVGNKDDIDHLGNRRIRSVGELLQNHYRIGISRLERVVRERMTTQSSEEISPKALINVKPITAAIREFFGSHQLSQFMDQNNPLSELTHKRRLSALGPGGLARDRAGFEVRDVHYTHYGRMCPVETPEGPNIGLINSLATFAKINEYGFVEAPYRKVDRNDPKGPRVTDEVIYMTADEEDNYIVAQANEALDENGYFVHSNVAGRFKEETTLFPKTEVSFMDVSPRMVFSVATSMIPFLQNDDANRALMGSNMQRQAVPLLFTDAPVVGTGMENKTAVDSGVCIVAKYDGTVEVSSNDNIEIRREDGTLDKYHVMKFARSNQGNCMNQRPIVKRGDKVKAGDVIADGASTQNGEIALGKNPLIGFMTWEGYNYEDAVLLSERLVKEDVYTSVHIEEYECEARNTKLGDEEITRDLSGLSNDALKDLDENGIVRIGAEVRAGDILVGKVTPKGETELTAEEKLLRAIFGEKAREVRDTSLRVPHGAYGVVMDTKVFTSDDDEDLPPGVKKSVRVYIAQKRKISVGDKMAGRHGNKGVVSRVLPAEDMPYLPNGRPLDIVLNPLGVPSRMNIGQVKELHLGLASQVLGFKVSTPIFEGANENDILNLLDLANDYANIEDFDEFYEKYKDEVNEDVMEFLSENRDHREEWKGVPIDRTGKVLLRDGRTGEAFASPVAIGFMHYLKLHHLVDDKIHARSTGPYSLVTQQPLGGKAQFGGQRFGEMEVWALEAYGASYTLQEILTVKSDDVVGRVKTYEAIIKGENIPEPGIPESFKVLLKEFQALGLDVRILDEDGNEIELGESEGYDANTKEIMDEDDKLQNKDRYENNVGFKTGDLKDIVKNPDEDEDDAAGSFISSMTSDDDYDDMDGDVAVDIDEDGFFNDDDEN